MFPQLNLQLWKTDAPALQVPEAILIQTLEKGTQGLARRRKEEYKLWESSKFFFSTLLCDQLLTLLPLTPPLLQTWALTPSRRWVPPSPSPARIRRPSACPTPRFCSSTHPGSSSTRCKSKSGCTLKAVFVTTDYFFLHAFLHASTLPASLPSSLCATSQL